MTRFLIISAAALAATACQVEQAPKNEVANEATPSDTPVVPTPTQPAANEVAPIPPAAAPEPAPSEPPATPDAEKSAGAAVAVVQRYCDGIAHKKYGQAYRLWASNGEASGMIEGAFARAFAKYDAFDCSFGPPGPIEGAAGSAYVDIPVVVTGTLAKGGGFVMRGPISLRRVNDVPGSTQEQRHWHISASGLKPRP